MNAHFKLKKEPSTIQTYIYAKNIPNICVVKCTDIILILSNCDPATGSRD